MNSIRERLDVVEAFCRGELSLEEAQGAPRL